MQMLRETARRIRQEHQFKDRSYRAHAAELYSDHEPESF